ncbi:MAG TPA: SDR family oxidoreductase [Anaerolineae bacterium]|nr:SDR family oxidoreductase [Anaerolineae bacterium]
MTTNEHVVVVTGGGAGIGKACALRFAHAGWRVVVNDISTQDGERTRAVIEERGGQALFCRGDGAKQADCEAFARAALDAWGRIDALVANAGVQLAGSLLDASESDWDKILGVNLKGVGYSCKAVLPAMIQQRSGAIVIISSLNAAVGVAHMPIYDASKAGVLGLMRSLAVAYGQDGIRVNAIGPGATITDFHVKRAAERGMSADELRAKTKGYGLLGRAAEPQEIAAAVYFLASAEASNITGQFLLVDGGASLTGGK